MITLVLGSFWYTEKTVDVMKMQDDIMIEIQNVKEEYQEDAVNAEIKGNTIIPGLHGEVVDESKSYQKMKSIGMFDENLLAYTKVDPDVSLKNHKNKFILQGNETKKMVSLLFLIEKDTKVEAVKDILSILDEKQKEGTFFIDGNFLEQNKEFMLTLRNYELGNLSYDQNYQSTSFLWLDAILKNLSNTKEGYCFFEEEKIDDVSVCVNNHNYSILVNSIISKDPFLTVKKDLHAGQFFAFSISSSLKTELPLILDYIYSKGYTIENLKTHLEE